MDITVTLIKGGHMLEEIISLISDRVLDDDVRSYQLGYFEDEDNAEEFIRLIAEQIGRKTRMSIGFFDGESDTGKVKLLEYQYGSLYEKERYEIFKEKKGVAEGDENVFEYFNNKYGFEVSVVGLNHLKYDYSYELANRWE